MIKNSQPLPILFNLMNSGNDGAFTDFAWASFFLMLENPESSIFDYINNLSSLFSLKDIELLSERFKNKRNKQIQMNQKHVIIMFAMIKANLIIYSREKEILNKALQIREIDQVKDELDDFILKIDANLVAFKKMFKSNHGISSAFAQISEK